MPYGDLKSAVEEIISDVKCEPFTFRVETVDDSHVILYAGKWRKDVVSGEEGQGWGGPYVIDTTTTVDNVVKRCFVACRDYAEHEIREGFLFHERKIFDPHMPIGILVEATFK